MIMEKFLTCSQVAGRTGYDKETVRRWCRDGVLPAFKVGVEWLVNEKDLPAAKAVKSVDTR